MFARNDRVITPYQSGFFLSCVGGYVCACVCVIIFFGRYVEASSAEAVTATMSSAVEQGLRAAAKADARKAKEQADTAKELLGLDIQAGQVRRRRNE